jgi:hypothetical protein
LQSLFCHFVDSQTFFFVVEICRVFDEDEKQRQENVIKMAKRTQEDLLVPESIIVESQRRRGERVRERERERLLRLLAILSCLCSS